MRFTAQLLPGNEVPPVTNADSSGSGTVTVILKVTRDASQNVTAATADFSVALAGFPAGTAVSAAQIHPGVAGLNGSPAVNLALTAGEIVLANGTGSISKPAIPVSPADLAQQIINNPAAYYFNVHTTLTPGGAIRGQLVKQ